MSQPLALVTTPPFPLAGELAALGAAFTWAISISMYSRFGKSIPVRTLNLYKNSIALLGLLALVAMLRPSLPADPKYVLWLGLSGVIGLSIGDTAFFGSLKRLGAQMTSATQCLSPPLTALIALLFLGEQLTFFEAIGMIMTVMAVSAVIFFNKRSGGILAILHGRELGIGLICALTAALCQAVSVVISRFALQHTHALVATSVRLLPAIAVLYLAALSRQEWRPLAPLKREKSIHLIFLGIAAIVGTCLGLLLLALATKYTKAGIAAAISSTYPVWIIPLAGLFLKEKVTVKSVIFTMVAVCGIGLMLVVT